MLDTILTLDDSSLGRALVKGVAPQGPVMVTWANYHYLDFVLNWVAHMRQCSITGFLVGAMDDRILQVWHSLLSASQRSAYSIQLSCNRPTFVLQEGPCASRPELFLMSVFCQSLLSSWSAIRCYHA